jgi:hypothetical protein
VVKLNILKFTTKFRSEIVINKFKIIIKIYNFDAYSFLSFSQLFLLIININNFGKTNKFITEYWNLQIKKIYFDLFEILKLDRRYQYSSTKKIKIIEKSDENIWVNNILNSNIFHEIFKN